MQKYVISENMMKTFSFIKVLIYSLFYMIYEN